MTSHLPLALSLLGTFASHYAPSVLAQKAPAPPPSAAPSGPAASNASVPSLPAAPPKPSGNANAASATSATSSAISNPGSTAITTSNSTILCEFCQLRPKYFDGTKTHPYCSKTCANKKANANGSQATSSPNSANCDFCHNRPKYSDGTKTHDYCSKACARSATGPHRKMTSSGAPTIGTPPAPSSIPPPAANRPPAVCQAPGCNNPPHPGGHEYCSIAHKTLGETLCLMCLQEPKMAHSHFCSQTCIDDAEGKGPMILEVPAGHVTFKNVSDQFKASWRHAGTVCPPVRRVYKILVPPASLAAYNAYKAGVEAKGQFASNGRSEGNENRRWHGTRRICNLGDKGHTQFCGAANCSLCNIIRTSYDISLFGKKTGWGRFGKGLYTSSTSSKSNDYSHNDCKSNLKAILLNKVVVGKGCKMTQDHTSLTAPPAGFDSVLAEKGGSLNYDELVVYSNDAIRPSFLVMYES